MKKRITKLICWVVGHDHREHSPTEKIGIVFAASAPSEFYSKT